MKYSNKMVHTADIHFSERTYKDIIKPFNEFLDFVKKEKPMFVIISGDYYDKVIENKNPLYVETIDYLIDISYNCKYLIILRGTLSHDYYNLNILNTISSLKNNIYFFDKKTDIKIDNFNFLILPEEYHLNMEEYYKDIYNEEYDFVIGHGMLSGAKMHDNIDNIKLKSFMFNVERLEQITKHFVLFGHIHIPQKLGKKTFYSGSLARWQFGEEHKKSFNVINLDDFSINFVDIKSLTNYKTITEEDLISIPEEKLIEDIKKAEIRFKGSKYNNNIKKILDKINIEKNIKYLDTDINLKISEFLDNNLLHKSIENLSINEQFIDLNKKYVNKIKNKKQKTILTNSKMFDKIKKISNIELKD